MTNTPEYNNGLWHGWNGGECPVHHLSWVNVMLSCGTLGREDKEAKVYDWDHTSANIVAFKVTKEHKEPQEYWLCYRFMSDAPEVRILRPDKDGYYITVTHVREVT